MRHGRIAALAVLLSAASWQDLHSETVQDPAQDYFLRFQTPPDLRLDIDLDNDGIPEVFLSNERLQNGKAGRIWTVYRGEAAGGWSLLEKPATFRPDLLKVDPAANGKPASLLTFWPGGAGLGTVQRISLTGGEIAEEKVEEISESAVPQYFDPAAPSAISPKAPASFAGSPPQASRPRAAHYSRGNAEKAPAAAPARSNTRIWIIAGIALLLVYSVLHATVKRKW